MARIEDSTLYMFLRKAIWISPFMIIGGIIMMFIDVDIGGPLLGIGSFFMAIFIGIVLKVRNENKNAPKVEFQHVNPQAQPAIEFQATPENSQFQVKSQAQMPVDARKKNFCVNCGSKINENMQICENCGALL